MTIGIFGESCTGKSTIAEELKKELNAVVYTGKDYIKLAKSEAEAARIFKNMLSEKSANTIIYVISEKEHLAFLPQNSLRVLVTADLETIKTRFAKRLNGNLSAPLAAMLERRHGSFDSEKYDLHISGGDLKESVNAVLEMIKDRNR